MGARGAALLLPLLARGAAAQGWRVYADSDCGAGKEVGSCSSAGQPEDCEQICAATQGCGGFTWPHKHLKPADCAASIAAVAGRQLYVAHPPGGAYNTTQGPAPPPPPPVPTRAPDATHWWYFAGTDCEPGVDIGSCHSAGSPDDCKAACLSNPECGGFNWPHKNFKQADCFFHRRPYNGIDTYVLQDVPQPAPTPAPTGVDLVPYYVDNDKEAVCSDGSIPAGVYHIQDAAGWVLQLGAAPTLDFCISEQGCLPFGRAPNATPAPEPPPGPHGAQYFGGPWSPDCTINPDFCNFSQASIPALCDKALGLGAADRVWNGTAVFFRGLRVLDAAIKKLAAIGLSKAQRVLLVGIGHGGTAAIFLADRIAALLRAVAPALQVYKVLPTDGIHPNFDSMLDLAPFPGTHFEWYQGALQFIANASGALGALPQQCRAANRGREWRCLYANETLPYVSSPVFAVQQLASVWDMQCMADGQPVNNVLQVTCTNHGGNYWRAQYTCTQYPDLCQSWIVANFTVPFQRAYLDDYTRIGAHSRKGGGGFFHSCYLGNYLPSIYNATGQWNLIRIGNLSMQQAVGAWWRDDSGVGQHWHPDQVWDPAGQPGAADSDAHQPALDTIDAPVAPEWTCRYMRNPSCKAFRVWY